MAYVVFGYAPTGTRIGLSHEVEAARIALQRAIERDGRFRATLTPAVYVFKTRHLPEGWSFVIERVRLTTAKEYCGPRFPRKKARHTYLEWDDWVAFHHLVNDVLDRIEVHADAWTNPPEPLSVGKKFWIRKGNKRRVRFEWDEQYRGGIRGPMRVWNAGTPDQFEPATSEIIKDAVAKAREAARTLIEGLVTGDSR